jgi:hypothetical protein
MKLNRQKLVGFLAMTWCVISAGVVWSAPAPPGPVRVLIMASGPTREYQFVRTMFVKLTEQKKAELTILLTSATKNAVQDVPADRLLKEFPTRMITEDMKDKPDNKYGNLAQYDVIIAFDADWEQLNAEQGKLLDKWVRETGNGLIIVAGPIKTLDLVRKGAEDRHKAILDLLPVRLADPRKLERETKKPWPLAFPKSEKYLKLEADGTDALAGWSEFFFDKQRKDWMVTEDAPVRGFYSAFPVAEVKKDAEVVATFRDPETKIKDGDKKIDLPYLVTMKVGRGRTIYLGSGETWRLRQYRENYPGRFWLQLARYAANGD